MSKPREDVFVEVELIHEAGLGLENRSTGRTAGGNSLKAKWYIEISR
jgi:hypothetical protein